MRNARLEEAQAGIKIAGRNINNLRVRADSQAKTEGIMKDNSRVSEEGKLGKVNTWIKIKIITGNYIQSSGINHNGKEH